MFLLLMNSRDAILEISYTVFIDPLASLVNESSIGLLKEFNTYLFAEGRLIDTRLINAPSQKEWS